MNVSILVCTYGSSEWAALGRDAALAALDVEGAHQRVAHHDPVATLAEVRNEAAWCASGDWLCFLDADDRLSPSYIEEMAIAAATLEVLAADARVSGNPRAHLLVPAVQYVRPGCTSAAPIVPAWGRDVLDLNAGVIGTLVPRDLFLEVGGFRELELYEDWDLWLRCLIAGARPVAVPAAVYLADGAPGRNEPDPETRQRVYWQIRHEHAPHLEGRRWA